MISTSEIYNVLLLEFPYFKKINEHKRQLLCRRTQEFIEGTKFIPRKEMHLTDRMKILISACSQQLTLGFKKYYEFAYFDKIIVYPEKYFSTITGKYHAGEMNTAGIIVLSWQDFYNGMSVDDNAHNVGLHEFAHALEFMDIADKDIDDTYAACLDKFMALAADYLKHQPDRPLFRKYATTNLSEFLAVATEYYFEKPLQFFEQAPELFDMMDKAYQQNMLEKTKAAKKTNDFTYKKMPTGKLIFGSESFLLNSFLTFMIFVLLHSYFGFIIYHKPLIGIVFLAIGNYIFFRIAFKNSFMLYSGCVKIQYPVIIKLAHMLLPDFFKVPTIVTYENILYVALQETTKSRFNVSEMKHNPIYSYSLTYWHNGKIFYAINRSDMKNYNTLLKFLYLEKKVAVRVNGNLKKY